REWVRSTVDRVAPRADEQVVRRAVRPEPAVFDGQVYTRADLQAFDVVQRAGADIDEVVEPHAVDRSVGVDRPTVRVQLRICGHGGECVNLTSLQQPPVRPVDGEDASNVVAS